MVNKENNYILSTIAGVESLAKREILKEWWKIIEVRDRMIEFTWNDEVLIRVNLWSRVWNKVYKVLIKENNVDNFDKLYDLVYLSEIKEYFKHKNQFKIKVKTINSDLTSVPTIQKIATKAIINNITNNSWERVLFDKEQDQIEILVLIINNKLRILLNTTWEALHKRWYRKETWEAPIKENLAAALVLLSWWRFKEPFYDIFCGSWTIAIEAAMIAKNIAPWLNRDFIFNSLGFINKELFNKQKDKARKKIYNWDYNIIASDIEDYMIGIAKENAKKAWVSDIIVFKELDFNYYLTKPLDWILVSNPPYGDRLDIKDINDFYNKINNLLINNSKLRWWIITSYFLWFNKIINLKKYKRRKLYNWWEKTYFYKKR